jgi:hypothetical protein
MDKRGTRAICAAVLALLVAGGGAWLPDAGARAAVLRQTPSEEEIRALVGRTIANQHGNDEAIAAFERRERRVTRKRAADAAPSEDKTFRVVPTGTGTIKLLLEEHGRTVPPERYRQQLRELEQALVWALDPRESKQKKRVEKWNARQRERREAVDGVAAAFRFRFLGRENGNGRRLVKLAAEPDPSFKPRTRVDEMFRRARATLWIDEEAAQLARVEAELESDLSFGGGILGKVYRGGRFLMEQAEAAPGLWLPTRFEYHFDGRKFVFGFELNEITTISAYRRIGPPAEALAAVRHELNNGGAARPAQ